MQTNVTSDNLLRTHTGSHVDEKVSKEEMHTTELLEYLWQNMIKQVA